MNKNNILISFLLLISILLGLVNIAYWSSINVNFVIPWNKDETTNSTPSNSWWGTPAVKDDCPNWDYSSSYYDGSCGDVIIKPQEASSWTIKEETGTWEKVTWVGIELTGTWEIIEETGTWEIFVEDNNSNNSEPEENITSSSNNTSYFDWTYQIIDLSTEDKKCEKIVIENELSCHYYKVDRIDFDDIDKSFAKDYIYELSELWIVNWYYWSKNFKPNNIITRWEFLKVLLWWFCYNYKDIEPEKLFVDVENDQWVSKVITKANWLGLIDISKDNFRPNDPITRAEAMKFLISITNTEYWNLPSIAFSDVNKSWWEAKYIQKAKDMCIINWEEIIDNDSNSNKTVFRPFDNMTREEFSKILYNSMWLRK